VVTLTLNDPARFNALGSEMLTALQQALDAVAHDDSARVVVLAAGKAFCAGHNLKDMAAHPELAWYQQLFSQCSRMMLSIHKLPVPVIARVQGMATAAGCQLVAQCDLAVASDNASFATSGIHYGLFCATPSVPLVRNVPAKRAMEMLLTGDFIDAPTALAQGPGQPGGGARCAGRRSREARAVHCAKAPRGHCHGQGAGLPAA
jgi:enoyl-CoA hydratase/carnithine racemase